ncbi:hypothetical protein KR018_005671 [Drosophila ironensis]|nr:hypothetical protein KR018_005671 [Drosophila ironensis]
MARNAYSDVDISASSNDIGFYKAKAAALQLQLLAVGKVFEAKQMPDMDEAKLQMRLDAAEKINDEFDKFQELVERADLTELASNARKNFTEKYFEVKSKILHALKKLKSRSLTHLDGFDTGVVACQHAPPGIVAGTGTGSGSTTADGPSTTASKTWSALVESDGMSEREVKIRTAIWELVTNASTTPGLYPSNSAAPASLGRQPNVLSSSEFFSVPSCLESSQHLDEQVLAATKDVTLVNALGPALRRRNLSFTLFTITDNNPTPSFF